MEYLKQIGCKVVGSPVWRRILPCDKAGIHDLTWFKNSELDTMAGTIICKPSIKIKKGRNYIMHENPKYILSVILERVQVKNKLTVGTNVVIGKNVIFHGDVSIGDNVIIEDNVVIGCEGAAYVKYKGYWKKLKHIGKTVIGNDVEIGCSSYIARSLLDETIIQDGVKIGHKVGIGHNVKIGNDTIILPFALIGGSAVVGNDCYISPHTFILNNSVVPDGTKIKSNVVR